MHSFGEWLMVGVPGALPGRGMVGADDWCWLLVLVLTTNSYKGVTRWCPGGCLVFLYIVIVYIVCSCTHTYRN